MRLLLIVALVAALLWGVLQNKPDPEVLTVEPLAGPTTTTFPDLPSTTTTTEPPPPPPTTTTTAPRARSAPIAPPVLADVPDETWDALAGCESGGRWDLDEGLFDGGLQFDPGTWIAAGGRRFAAFAWGASREEQIEIARGWLARTSWLQWPRCSRLLGLR